MRTVFLLLALTTAGCAAQPGQAMPAGRPPFGSGGRGALFISPVGEPFRGGPGKGDPARSWFDGADTNHDGRLTPAEFTADALRFFTSLDRGHDGEIDPEDIDFYENSLVPEIRAGGSGPGAERSGEGQRGGGRGRGGGMRGGHGPGATGSGGAAPGSGGQRAGGDDAARQGAGRFGYFDYPEPITAMDRNFNRGIDRDEMTLAAAERFRVLDRNGDGVIERGELPRLAARAQAGAPGSGRRPPPTRREDEAEPDGE